MNVLVEQSFNPTNWALKTSPQIGSFDICWFLRINYDVNFKLFQKRESFQWILQSSKKWNIQSYDWFPAEVICMQNDVTAFCRLKIASTPRHFRGFYGQFGLLFVDGRAVRLRNWIDARTKTTFYTLKLIRRKKVEKKGRICCKRSVW